jgi:glycosyltransferase involved in cell wall biosynthesis
MVTKFLPLPADSGGKQRSGAVLRLLASYANVTLFAFDDGHADMAALRQMGIDARPYQQATSLLGRLWGILRSGSVGAGRFYSQPLGIDLRDAARTADLVVIAYSQLARYGADLETRRLLDLHNIESALIRSYGAAGRGFRSWAAVLEAAALRRAERHALRHFDTVVVVSDADRRRLPGRAHRVLVCPNGVDVGPASLPSDEPTVAFVALMGWKPNADAALYLGLEIWPLVRRQMPDARLLLVGRDPGPEVVALAGPDITVTGRVEQVRPYLDRARVAVAPLRSGGGSRLKILEALAAGLPVVATTIGAEGLEDLIGSGIVVADDPDHFAALMIGLLSDPSRAAEVGATGRAAVTERYSWSATLAPLAQVLAELSRSEGDP